MSDQRTHDPDPIGPDGPADPRPSERGPVLVTGAAGFIGFHLSRRLLDTEVAIVSPPQP